MLKRFVCVSMALLLFSAGNVQARCLQPEVLQAVNDAIVSNATQACFDSFLPELRSMADEWSQAYNACVSDASSEKTVSAQRLQLDQSTINSTATYISRGLVQCQDILNELDFFSCFSALQRTALDAFYAITVNATDDINVLKQQSGELNAGFYRCTNDTERIYMTKTTQLNQGLDTCLNQAEASEEEQGVKTTSFPSTETVNSGQSITPGQADAGRTTAQPLPTETDHNGFVTVPIMSANSHKEVNLF